MTIESRFLLSFEDRGDSVEPGLIRDNEGLVWLIHPDGSRVQLTGGGGGGLPDPITTQVNISPTDDFANGALVVTTPAGIDPSSSVAAIQNSDSDGLFVGAAGQVFMEAETDGVPALWVEQDGAGRLIQIDGPGGPAAWLENDGTPGGSWAGGGGSFPPSQWTVGTNGELAITTPDGVTAIFAATTSDAGTGIVVTGEGNGVRPTLELNGSVNDATKPLMIAYDTEDGDPVLLIGPKGRLQLGNQFSGPGVSRLSVQGEVSETLVQGQLDDQAHGFAFGSNVGDVTLRSFWLNTALEIDNNQGDTDPRLNILGSSADSLFRVDSFGALSITPSDPGVSVLLRVFSPSTYMGSIARIENFDGGGLDITADGTLTWFDVTGNSSVFQIGPDGSVVIQPNTEDNIALRVVSMGSQTALYADGATIVRLDTDEAFIVQSQISDILNVTPAGVVIGNFASFVTDTGDGPGIGFFGLPPVGIQPSVGSAQEIADALVNYGLIQSGGTVEGELPSWFQYGSGGSPVGSVNPTQKGALYQDFTYGGLYVATDANTGDWVQVGGGGDGAAGMAVDASRNFWLTVGIEPQYQHVWGGDGYGGYFSPGVVTVRQAGTPGVVLGQDGTPLIVRDAAENWIVEVTDAGTMIVACNDPSRKALQVVGATEQTEQVFQVMDNFGAVSLSVGLTEIGFFGAIPAAQPAPPTTLEDVIAGLQALGLFGVL